VENVALSLCLLQEHNSFQVKTLFNLSTMCFIAYMVWFQSFGFWCAVWFGGVMVTSETGDRKVPGSTPSRDTVRCQHLGHVIHTRASVTKQYNLVPVKGRWHFASGKITVGLASHCPCITDLSGLSSYGLHSLRKGDEHPAYAPVGVWHLYLYLCYWLNVIEVNRHICLPQHVYHNKCPI